MKVYFADIPTLAVHQQRLHWVGTSKCFIELRHSLALDPFLTAVKTYRFSEADINVAYFIKRSLVFVLYYKCDSVI